MAIEKDHSDRAVSPVSVGLRNKRRRARPVPEGVQAGEESPRVSPESARRKELTYLTEPLHR